MDKEKDQASYSVNSEEPFDLARLRIGQDFTEMIGVKKALLTVPVRKPTSQTFVRVHPDEAYRDRFAILERKEDHMNYLVVPTIAEAIPGEVAAKMLFTTIDRQGVISLWPIRLPGRDGRHDAWNRSALQAAQLAMTRWIRLASNMALGAYEVFEAAATFPDPEWPPCPFQQLLEIAFKDCLIDSIDHPVLQRLRGEL
jgi:hypothetical protein